jgi:UDP-4-amino-4,6-dideoxy-N-acetyl-beta-L-altrosamine transaminase
MLNKVIPYGKQSLTEGDIQAVVDALKSDFWTQGPIIPEFEKNFASYVGSKFAVAVSNGTAALHLCALALNLALGDQVITTPITFVASANCVRYCGAEVIFGDIDRETYLLDIHSVRKLLEEDTEHKIKGIIPVDFAGRVIDLEAYRTLADEFNCWIIEDACHAPGGSFINSKGESQMAGNGKYADLSIFSFHPVKHIASGEGGMITTNNEELYHRLLKLRTHGITKNEEQFENSISISGGSESYPNWYMEMQELGFNYRLTDIQAALGNSQLKRASEGIRKRRSIASVYNQEFKEITAIKTFSFNDEEEHAFHLYIIEVENREELYKYLRNHNIFTQIHYFPVHLMPYYQKLGWKKGDFPNAESYYEGCISLPMYPTLSTDQLLQTIGVIKEFYNK